jgi:hypothetical protein
MGTDIMKITSLICWVANPQPFGSKYEYPEKRTVEDLQSPCRVYTICIAGITNLNPRLENMRHIVCNLNLIIPVLGYLLHCLIYGLNKVLVRDDLASMKIS